MLSCSVTNRCPEEGLVYVTAGGIPANIPSGYFDSGYFHFTADEWAYMRVYGEEPPWFLERSGKEFNKIQSEFLTNQEKFMNDFNNSIKKYEEQYKVEIKKLELKREQENSKMLERYYQEYQKGQVNPDFNEEG